MPIISSQRLDQIYADDRRQIPDDALDVMFKRAEALSKADRMLLELAFKHNCTVRRLGELFEAEPGTISRRLRRICTRLREPIVAAILEPTCQLLPEYRQLAIEYFVQGLRLADLAEQHQMPLTQVRSIVHFVRAWFRGTHRQTRRGFSRV